MNTGPVCTQGIGYGQGLADSYGAEEVQPFFECFVAYAVFDVAGLFFGFLLGKSNLFDEEAFEHLLSFEEGRSVFISGFGQGDVAVIRLIEHACFLQ